MGIEIALMGASLAATAVSTVSGFAAAGAQGAAASSNAAYRAQVLRNNRILAKADKGVAKLDVKQAEQDAKQVSLQGQERIVEQDIRARQQIGQFAANRAASGAAGPSTLRAISGARLLAAQDRKNLAAVAERDNAEAAERVIARRAEVVNLENRIRGIDNEQSAVESEGRYAKAAARSAQIGSIFGGLGQMTGTILGGARNGAFDSFKRKVPSSAPGLFGNMPAYLTM